MGGGSPCGLEELRCWSGLQRARQLTCTGLRGAKTSRCGQMQHISACGSAVELPALLWKIKCPQMFG